MIGEGVYLNGQLCAKEAASVPVFDHGFLYGDGVFEGVAVVRNMDKLGPPTLVVIAQHETRALRSSVYEHGLAAIVSATRRLPPQCDDVQKTAMLHRRLTLENWQALAGNPAVGQGTSKTGLMRAVPSGPSREGKAI